MGDRPDGIIDGIKIIKGIDFGDNNPKHDLPASSHLSNSYIKYKDITVLYGWIWLEKMIWLMKM